jgi:hypothetical protein
MKTEEATTTATEAPKPGGAIRKRASATKRAAKPATKKASKSATPKKRRVKTETKSATRKAARPAAGKGEVRTGTKKAIVLALLRREQGATLAEIAKATDWQNQSIRGFISASVGKKMGLKVESAKNHAGERTYRSAK